MEISKVPLSSIPHFSKRDKAYIDEFSHLRNFYKYEVKLESFASIIKERSKSQVDRKLVYEVLMDQYSKFETSSKVKENVSRLLEDNAFTIITAHQPSLMTGPAYYVYKILSAIRLTQILKESYPEYQFVPVFITGGEDHDFEEVNHFNLFGNTISWETDQIGSVGKFQLDHGFDQMISQVNDILGNSENAVDLKSSIESIIANCQRYADFAIQLTNTLFQSLGLVVLDMSDKRFKSAFAELMNQELTQQFSQPLVEATQNKIEELSGFKAQALARPINLFYTGSGDRSRIESENSQYQIVGSDITFSEVAILEELDKRPESFSPNVVLRPLFQEFIMPNLAYIGGGGEIAYWLERKSQFDSVGVPFPMLIRRNSAIFIDKGSQKKMTKLGLSFNDLLNTKDEIISAYLKSKDGDHLEFQEELDQLNSAFEAIASKAQHIDPTLKPKILAEGTKIVKQVDQLTSRVKRAAKQNEEVAIGQIEKIVDKLFPNNGLQERSVSFLEMYLKHGAEIFSTLVTHFNPLEKTMVIIED